MRVAIGKSAAGGTLTGSRQSARWLSIPETKVDKMTEYFMQCGWSGNNALWWRDGKCGYTTDLDDAHRFPEDSARRQEAMREEDKAWPVDVVLEHSHRAISQDGLSKLDLVPRGQETP